MWALESGPHFGVQSRSVGTAFSLALLADLIAKGLSLITSHSAVLSYGRGAGVGRTLGWGLDLGVGVGRGVAVGVVLGVTVAVGVAVAVAVGVGVGVGVVPPAGAWIATTIGEPVLKNPTVALVSCGG